MFGKRKTQKVTEKVLMTAINTALDSAEVADSDTLLSETGKTRQQLLDAVMADDEVISCREDIEGAIVSAVWNIWGEDVDEHTVNRLYKMVRRLASEFADLAILAKFNGYAVAEYTYQKEPDGFVSIKDVLSKDGELDLYTPRRDGSVTLAMDGIDVEINQTVKFLVLKNKAVPARPAGELMIIRAYPAIALRKKDWAYAGQFIARYAQPYVVGKQGGDGYVDAQNALSNFTNKIFAFINGGAAGIGSQDSIELHQLSGNGEAFERFERLCNQRIQKLILGRVKTSELNVGSRAAQATDDKTRQNRVSSYLALMTKAVQHAIDAVIAVNGVYGVPVTAPKGIWFEYEQQFGVDKTRAERDKLYCDTGQVRLTKAYLTDIVGFEEEHIEMVEQTQSQSASPSQSQWSSHSVGNLANQQFVLSQTPVEDTTAKQMAANNIGQSKLDKILSVLNDCDDYAQFSQRLNDLSLPDGGMVSDLAKQTTDAFLKGLDGHVNVHGENQL